AVGDFRPERQSDDDEANDQYDENRWPIAGVGEGIVEPAAAAIWRDGKKTGEQAPLPAAGAAPFHSGCERIDCGPVDLIVTHVFLPALPSAMERRVCLSHR